MSPYKIAPSILALDFASLGEEIKACESAKADYIHIDVMDGQFVPNITIGPLIVEACKGSVSLPLDVHLMIVKPERYVKDFAQAGADHITIHAEATPHVHRVLESIKVLGCKAGLAVNPLTPLEFFKEALPLLDIALLMTVNPGFGGQEFISLSLARIERLRKCIEEINPQCELEVDGGINLRTGKDALSAGANVLVAGSAIFNQQNTIAANIKAFQEL